MTKELDTLIDDIYALFNKKGGHDVSEENLEVFANNVKDVLRKALKEANNRVNDKDNTLRMSKLGTPPRKLWYEFNTPPEQYKKELAAPTLIKFLYGGLLEELVILFAKEAGHKVDGEQDELVIDGVLGHRDCKIDGINVDIKSTSKFAFNKFRDATLFTDDPFGYVAQISAYVKADGGEKGGFIAINKETGELCLLKVGPVDMVDPVAIIKNLKDNVINAPEPPTKKCYEPEPHGKSGNLALNKNCEWCAFKELCWKSENPRKFKYSDGIKTLVKVVELPRVDEVL